MKAENKDAWLAIGRRIKEERTRRGLTQHALADAAELSDKFISNIERGARQPATKTLQAIAGALHLQPRDLYTDVPSTYNPLDGDLSQLASLLKDATPDQRAAAINVVRALVRKKRPARKP